MHADEGVSGRLVAQANLRKYIERREKNTQFDRTWIVVSLCISDTAWKQK
jgi:hypothetical protein